MYTKYNYMYMSTILIITTYSHTSMYTKYNYKTSYSYTSMYTKYNYTYMSTIFILNIITYMRTILI